jgi:hypothetical protein
VCSFYFTCIAIYLFYSFCGVVVWRCGGCWCVGGVVGGVGGLPFGVAKNGIGYCQALLVGWENIAIRHPHKRKYKSEHGN